MRAFALVLGLAFAVPAFAHEAKKMDAHEAHKDHQHKHGDKCGHKSVKHDGHVDYDHDGHKHKADGDHYDECKEAKS